MVLRPRAVAPLRCGLFSCVLVVLFFHTFVILRSRSQLEYVRVALLQLMSCAPSNIVCVVVHDHVVSTIANGVTCHSRLWHCVVSCEWMSGLDDGVARFSFHTFYLTCWYGLSMDHLAHEACRYGQDPATSLSRATVRGDARWARGQRTLLPATVQTEQ